MGTYTANYNLYMPTIGEQGWGELINGNFTTIDTTMKGLTDNITSLETTINNILLPNINENGVTGWLLLKFSTTKPFNYAESFRISGSVSAGSNATSGTVTTSFKIPSYAQLVDSTGDFTVSIKANYSHGGNATVTVTNLIDGSVYETFSLNRSGSGTNTYTRVMPLYASIYIKTTTTHTTVTITGPYTYLVPANY